MTPPMPTKDETPSAAAEAFARRYFNNEFMALADCLDAFAREREAAVWAKALRLLADHEDHDGAGSHGRTEGRVSDCIGELEQTFRTCAAEAKRTP